MHFTILNRFVAAKSNDAGEVVHMMLKSECSNDTQVYNTAIDACI